MALAPIKVYGTVVSNTTQRVLAALYEKELEFEFVPVNLRAGDHKKEPLISLNPFGQVPAFEQGDLKLFESRAITKYIAIAHPNKGSELLCQGKQMAILSVWMEVEAHQFDPATSKLVRELCFKPFFGMTTDAAAVEEQEAMLAKVLDVYESRLSQSKFLACDCFTLADLHHLPNLQLLMDTQCKKLFESRPHVSAWVADILARPAWGKVMTMKNH